MKFGVRLVAVSAAVAVTTGFAPTTAPATTGLPPGAHTVTLITGDRVTVDGTMWRVEPGPGRDGMTFSVDRSGEQLSVAPADALPLLHADRLDRRLFDVTTLLATGYDDASRDTLPLIVTYTGAVPRTVAAATVTRTLHSVNGSAVTAAKDTTTTMWRGLTTGRSAAGVGKIWLDGMVTPLLDHSVPQIGAPEAWAAGYTGAGVKVAVLDSGVDQTHPDLAGREVAERNFTDSPDNVDRYGHGTHIASTIAGSGARSGGRYKGVAPGADILDGRIFNDMGWSSDSWTIAGMEWAAEQGATIANMSLDGFDVPLLEDAVERLSAEYGILFVCAAGNAGEPGTIAAPASSDSALAVGAVDDQDVIAPFSSQGPSIHDGPVKPEITAPGVGIVAAKATEGVIGAPAEDGYVSMNGTSMATPHVAGAAAILAQRHPDWTGQQLKSALMASAKPSPGTSAFAQGAGRVDVARAITQVVTSAPTSVNLGTAAWPHTDDQPHTAPLTYHNADDADVTLDLAISGTAPEGMFSLGTTRLVVPAGGDAQVTVTADPRAGTTDGRFTALVRATGDGTSVSTPVAINREVESYDLTVDVRTPDGTPATDYTMRLLPTTESIDIDELLNPHTPYDPDGTVEVRLPKGGYSVLTTVIDEEGHHYLLPYPALTLDRDTSFVAAASAARPVRVTPPDPAAAPDGASVGIDMTYANLRTPVTVEFYGTGVADFSLAPAGPALPADRMSTQIGTHLAVPGGDHYFLAWFVKGAVPAGFSKVVRRSDLATVKARLHHERPGMAALRGAIASPVDGAAMWSGAYLTEPPAERTEYYSTDGVRWQGTLDAVDPDTGFTDRSLSAPLTVYRPGCTYQARFGDPVIGPAFLTRVDDVPDAARSGDLIDVWLHVFGDGAGNSGDSAFESATTTLYRDGTLVGESRDAGIGIWRVPAEPDDYRLVVEAERDPAFDVSTRLAVTWTFRSAHADGVEPLPLSAVRFSPALAADNTAPAGKPFVVPVAVQAMNGALYSPNRLTVDVSYDEGQTWQQATVRHKSAVLLTHPATATSVSLRATATDNAGNTVEQTVIRAYTLR
jgi:subtilisin family serine protease